MLRCLLAVLALAAIARAAEPTWFADYAAARKEADAQKKPILVVVGTEQCSYCRKLETTTFKDADVQSFVGDKFIALKIDANRDADLAKALKVAVYPTTVIAGPDGKIYGYLQGYLTAESFQTNAKKALALIPEEKGKEKEKPAVVASLKQDLRDPPLSVAIPKTGPIEPTKPAASGGDAIAAAKAAYEAGQFGDCIEACESILRTRPNGVEAERAKALIVLVKEDSGKLLKAGEQLDEKFAAAYVLLAEGLSAKGKDKEAATYYEKALRLAPDGKLSTQIQIRLQSASRDTATRNER